MTACDLQEREITTGCRVEEWGRGSPRDVYQRWDAVIAHGPRNETLYAGEIIGSGTVCKGCRLEQGRFLSAGALSELEVSGLGTVRTRLVRP
jgi:2-keto-4-pentenoate hydratase/2-oxohepta-3-ene-1,7-dioic acid hydratase in catechol pathway